MKLVPKIVTMTDREIMVLLKILQHTVPDIDDQEIVVTLVERLELKLKSP